MSEDLISFETAKLAKDKGFEEYCFSYYDLKGNKKDNYLENGSSTDVEFRVDLEDLLDNFNRGISNTYSVPTQSLLQKWLREVHNIIVELLIFDKGFLEKDKFCYQWRVYNNTEDWFTGFEFKTYEEALEIGLQEGLKLIPNE